MPTETDLLREILACPDEDAPRLAYADWLEETAGSAECGWCRGSGRWERPFLSDQKDVKCAICYGTGRVSDGRAERAEFIRVQCELADSNVTDNEVLFWDGQLGNGPEYYQKEKALRRREWELLEAPCVPGGKSNRELWFSPFDEQGEQVPGDFGGSWRRLFDWGYRRGFVHAITLTAANFLKHADAIRAAQPVREVTLTTWPSELGEHVHGAPTRERLIEELERRWPGIDFYYPVHP